VLASGSEAGIGYVAYFCKVGQPFPESLNTGQIDNAQGDLLMKKNKPSNV